MLGRWVTTRDVHPDRIFEKPKTVLLIEGVILIKKTVKPFFSGFNRLTERLLNRFLSGKVCIKLKTRLVFH